MDDFIVEERPSAPDTGGNKAVSPPANPMASLLELSHELLHLILVEIEPSGLSALSRSCHTLHSYIHGNRLLHKDLYTRRYDEPNASVRGSDPVDWEDAIHRSVKLEKLLDSDKRDVKDEHLEFVGKEICRMVETANAKQSESKNMMFLDEKFRDVDNIDAFLCASSLFGRAGNEQQYPAKNEELRQLSAKLHCLYGVPIDVVPSRAYLSLVYSRNLSMAPSSCTRSHARPLMTHTFARSKVYDLREYTDDTLWGPFMADGSQRVDWEKVEAVMIVLGYNLRKFHDEANGTFPLVWKDTWKGATPKSFKNPPRIDAPEKDMDDEKAEIRELRLALDAQDPYGVSGSWMRVVCFLDYSDLYEFNFSEPVPDDQLRKPLDKQEALRLIRIKLQVTRVEPPGSGDEDEEEDGMDWSNFRGERLPVVHFKGTSRSMHQSWDPNANSRIKGSVRQTPEGEIRWTTFSIFHGEERWRSEGIQVGGLRSARGILGNWFDKDYDLHGPAGPTAFWKESDDLEDDKTSKTSWLPYATFE